MIIIGSGFAGLSAACCLAKAGCHVTVLEKHATPGGRARQLKQDGFTFDRGPSWYWMPDIFERFFSLFGKSLTEYYTLRRLDPSYRIYWHDGYSDVPASLPAFKAMLEELEPGAGKKLDAFLQQGAAKYRIGMQQLVFKPGQSLWEFANVKMIRGLFTLDVFTSIKRHIHQHFQHPKIRQLLEFPVLFLGALPENTPALYSLMNYADIVGGTWYPKGGMYSIVTAMYTLAEELGVQFHFNENVTALELNGCSIREVTTEHNRYTADVVVGGADYHFMECLLPASHRSYSEAYWNSRVMAPSALLYYVGLNKRLQNIRHHSLVFDVPFDQHAQEIYSHPSWPKQPLFYVGAPSVTDPSVAPPGCENLFFLIPVAAGLTGDDDTLRNRYFQNILERFEQHTGQTIRDTIICQRSFAVSDFTKEYNAFKGNAYGLANTLKQTAIWKPSCRSKKVSNLFFTGQLTVPGPGVPPALISGEVVAAEVLRYFE